MPVNQNYSKKGNEETEPQIKPVHDKGISKETLICI